MEIPIIGENEEKYIFPLCVLFGRQNKFNEKNNKGLNLI